MDGEFVTVTCVGMGWLCWWQRCLFGAVGEVREKV